MACTKDLYDFMELCLHYSESPSTPACPCLLYLLHKGAMEIAMPSATGTLSLFSLSPSMQRDSFPYLLPPQDLQIPNVGVGSTVYYYWVSMSLGSMQWDLLLVMAWYWVISSAKYCGKVLSSCKSKVRMPISLEHIGLSL